MIHNATIATFSEKEPKKTLSTLVIEIQRPCVSGLFQRQHKLKNNIQNFSSTQFNEIQETFETTVIIPLNVFFTNFKTLYYIS